MRSRHKILAVAMAAFVQLCVPRAAVSSLQKEQLLEIVSSQHALIDSLELLYEGYFEPTDASVQDEAGYQSVHMAYKNDKEYCQIQTGRGEALRGIETRVWDGNYQKKHYILDNAGLVDAKKAVGPFRLHDSPVDYMMMLDTHSDPDRQPHYGSDLFALLSHPESLIRDEHENVNGTDCIVIEDAPAPYTTWLVYLDPKRGYIPIRRECLDYGGVEFRVDNIEIRDCGGGIWIPQRTRKTKYSIKSDGTSSPIYTRIMQLNDVNVNDEVDSTLFEYQFPNGTLMYDAIANVSYETGIANIDLQILEDIATLPNFLTDLDAAALKPSEVIQTAEKVQFIKIPMDDVIFNEPNQNAWLGHSLLFFALSIFGILFKARRKKAPL